MTILTAKVVWQYVEQTGDHVQSVRGELVDCEDLFQRLKEIPRIAYAELSNNGKHIETFDR